MSSYPLKPGISSVLLRRPYRLRQAFPCMDAFRLYSYQSTSSPYHPTRTTQIGTGSNMSNITLSDLTYVSREELADKLRNSSSAPQFPDNLAIIDVRDSDHIGGHIRGSTWVPSGELDYKMPELLRTLKDKEIVVFHCALSQQRGPSAALRYLREKRRLDPASTTVTKDGKEIKEADRLEKEGEGNGEKDEERREQKVMVLRGGFTEWQEKYGPDKQLTEAWKKDIWEFGY